MGTYNEGRDHPKVSLCQFGLFGLKTVAHTAEELKNMRLEHDFLGNKEVPSDAYMVYKL